MTETLAGGSRTATVTVRSYRPVDHHACRQLWAELTEEHRELYAEPQVRDADPGAAFEEYLTRLDLSGMWVAEDTQSGVVGFVGLLLDGRVGEVEPVVVTGRRRGEGIGRMLLTHVAHEARRRSLRELTISPALRNVEAVRCLHAAGFGAAASLRLSLDLTGREDRWRDGLDLHGVRFRY
jgi:GNAT superfamily N-acetyltransferase